jgi:hypothetical protein
MSGGCLPYFAMAKVQFGYARLVGLVSFQLVYCILHGFLSRSFVSTFPVTLGFEFCYIHSVHFFESWV